MVLEIVYVNMEEILFPVPLLISAVTSGFHCFVLDSLFEGVKIMIIALFLIGQKT